MPLRLMPMLTVKRRNFAGVRYGCVLLLLFLLAPMAAADERRQSTADTARHSPPPEQRSPDRTPQRTPGRMSTPSVQGRQPTLLEEIDPAVRQYWSDKCVQQRARGWGRTGDCNHPAYSGSYYRQPPVIIVPERSLHGSRRRGHIGIDPPRPGGRGHLR